MRGRSARISEIELLKEQVAVVLIDAEISSCDDKRGVVVDVHQQRGGDALLPCVVAKGLAQGMAADVRLAKRFAGGLLDDAVCLRAAQRLCGARGPGEDIVCGLWVFLSAERLERFGHVVAEGDDARFFCLFFAEKQMLYVAFLCKLVDVLPSQLQYVAYAQRRVKPEHDEAVVAGIRFCNCIIVCEFLYVCFTSDRLCCSHFFLIVMRVHYVPFIFLCNV